MAYNPIAPTSSRENRKPPTNIPQNVVVILDGDGDLAYATSGTEAAYLVIDGDGDPAISDSADGGARAVGIGGAIIMMEES